MNSEKKGILYGVFSYVFWGLTPLYWRLLVSVSPLHILGFRIVFALVFTALALIILKNKTWLLLLKRDKLLLTILSGLIISLNWGIYIWAVNSGYTLEASLGYYINPLTSILLAMIILGEKLTVLQKTAFGFAALGVLLVTIFSGVIPWVSLILAITFSLYGLIKKKNKSGSLEALGAETLAVLPLGIAILIFSPADLPQIISPLQWALIVFCGFVTALPLFTFAKAAKLLTLTSIGFLQFISPTMIFFLGVFVFGEDFSLNKLWAFGCIWIAVALYCFSLKKQKNI